MSSTVSEPRIDAQGERTALGQRAGERSAARERRRDDGIPVAFIVDRGPHLRHGIALDRQLTIILSQTDTDRPLCGIYFNLHSPYQKKHAHKKSDVKSQKSDEL